MQSSDRPSLRRWVAARSLLPLLSAAAGLLLLSLLCLWLSGFGFPYLFRAPGRLDAVPAAGDLVSVPVSQLDTTFSYLGYQDAQGNAVVEERYCLYPLAGQYLVVRVTKDFVPLLERADNTEELIASGEIGSVLELNLGEVQGTVNQELPQEVYELLRNWLVSHQLDGNTLTDRLNGADLSAYPGAAEGDYSAYLDAVILPLMLETGYLGSRQAGTVRVLSILAVIPALLALLCLLSLALGFWRRPYRAACAAFGAAALQEDFAGADHFGSLALGSRLIWVRSGMTARWLETGSVIWAFPRSRRLEGGRKRWLLVLRTADGQEAVADLREESRVEQAAACLARRCGPLTLGYDSEKQKLYEKDLQGFLGRVRNGKL